MFIFSKTAATNQNKHKKPKHRKQQKNDTIYISIPGNEPLVFTASKKHSP